jgi:3-hydroxyisobutyrate dehydrogenase
MSTDAAPAATPDVAFVGLGLMGRHMAGHLQRAGHRMHLHNRSRAGAEPLLAQGAAWYPSAGEAAAHADVVITIVGFPSDVETLYLGPGGIVERARPGALLIDMTTSSPDLAVRIAAAAAARGLQSLDAPVSGGDVGAREARLSIMTGGDAAAFERARPLLERMGANVMRQGGPGAGQHAKLANQIVIASTMMGVAEGLAYARRAGLDASTVLGSIRGGAAGSFLLDAMGPRMLKGDYAAGFFTEHFVKDLGLALAEAGRMGLELPGLALAKRLYDALVAEGRARDGTQVLFARYGG